METFLFDLWDRLWAYKAEGLNILIAVGVFFSFVLLRKIFSKYIFRAFLKLTEKTKTDVDEYILRAFEKPLRIFITILGLYFSSLILPLGEFHDQILLLFRTSVIILLAWGIANLADTSGLWIDVLGKKYNFEIDKIIIPFLSKVIKFVIYALAISIIAEEWDYNVNGLITGLGLGGLAFALAAKDSIGNIFGGIIIITEKPFTIGDWIKTPSVEGTIEDITFRSTRIRAFSQAVVTIPNSTLANEPITNWSRMGKRRITFNLGLMYSTPREKIIKVVEKIKKMLEDHPEIHQETIFVRFDSFNDSSLDLFLYFFTKTTVWGEWLRVKEDCNLRILEILEQEEVSVAFPSTSVYFENQLKQADQKK